MRFAIIFAFVLMITIPTQVSVWGDVTAVPNVFSSGTSAKAADVNANFNALVKALPGMHMDPFGSAPTALSATWKNLGSVTITAPSSGYCLVRVSGTGITGTVAPAVALSTNTTTPAGSYNVALGQISATVPFSIEYPFTVPSGANTFYFLGYSSLASTFSFSAVFTVEFFPNYY